MDNYLKLQKEEVSAFVYMVPHVYHHFVLSRTDDLRILGGFQKERLGAFKVWIWAG